MLNQSNRNVPTRRVEFQNVKLSIVESAIEDPTKTRTYTTHVSADVDQVLDGEWALATAMRMQGNYWNTEEVSVEHSFIDSTDQYIY
tara:strand:+ start:5287 stop:5547 length:261 start_codon:yes stop_codon:yes gene_type:complete